MNRKLISIALAIVLAMGLPLLGCQQTAGEEPNPEANPDAITVTDQTGNVVTLDGPAERVVVLTASSCEIVYALGAGDTVVGRGEYCDWPSEALSVEMVASGAETNVEQIIALAPQIVFMSTMAQSVEQVDQLEQAGIKVYSSDASDIAGTYADILAIGALVGKDAEAQAIVDGMKQTFETISQNKLDGGTIYFEVSPLEFGLWAAGSNTFMNEAAEIVGLTNIFADVEGWVEVSEEQVLERNPDYILTVGMYFGEGLLPDEEILSREAWQGVTAVQNGAILNLSNNELSRPGPRLAEGVQALYDFVKERQG